MIIPRQHLYLSGFMGAGKTTLGIILARQLGLPFLDTDQKIAEMEQSSISQIFKNKKKGETYFRALEYQLLLAMQTKIPHVISLGGGMVLSFQNREILRRAYWINLNVSANTAWRRISGSAPGSAIRPLAKKNQPTEFFNLYQQRQTYYRMAPIQVFSDGRHPLALVQEISRKIARS